MTGCMRGWHDNPQKGGDIITKVKLDYKDGLSYLIGLYEKTPGHRGSLLLMKISSYIFQVLKKMVITDWK